MVAWKGPVKRLKQWYIEGLDVHLKVCQDIARVVQESKITIASGMFTKKHWSEYSKDDIERYTAKRTVHANNYGMGKSKFALITNLQEEHAEVLQRIYFTLFPEVKSKYQKWVEDCIKRTRTIWMPPPVKFRKIFYDIVDDELLRSAYSCYPQCTVSAMLNRTLTACCNIFAEDKNEKLKDQWCAWYGKDNWDHWRAARDADKRDPQSVLWRGMDIRLNVHDAGGISVPNDADMVRWAAHAWRASAETPIHIDETTNLVIPVDFKTGPTWGDLHDYKP